MPKKSYFKEIVSVSTEDLGDQFKIQVSTQDQNAYWYATKVEGTYFSDENK